MPKITASHLKVAHLKLRDQEEMFRLFSLYYRNTDFETFQSDLLEKDQVFCFRNKMTRELLGFSTIYKKSEQVPKVGKVTYIFSGDTVMDRKIWGSKILQLSFFYYIFLSKLKSPFQPVYWMLMSKGYKTYMMMRRNFAYSFPSSQQAIPSKVRLVKDFFYRRKFGGAFSPKTNLIIYSQVKDSVKDGYACPEKVDLNNETIRFFTQVNPGYNEGHELACVAEIRFRDFPRHVMKYMFKPLATVVRKSLVIFRPNQSENSL